MKTTFLEAQDHEFLNQTYLPNIFQPVWNLQITSKAGFYFGIITTLWAALYFISNFMI